MDMHTGHQHSTPYVAPKISVEKKTDSSRRDAQILRSYCIGWNVKTRSSRGEWGQFRKVGQFKLLSMSGRKVNTNSLTTEAPCRYFQCGLGPGHSLIHPLYSLVGPANELQTVCRPCSMV